MCFILPPNEKRSNGYYKFYDNNDEYYKPLMVIAIVIYNFILSSL